MAESFVVEVYENQESDIFNVKANWHSYDARPWCVKSAFDNTVLLSCLPPDDVTVPNGNYMLNASICRN